MLRDSARGRAAATSLPQPVLVVEPGELVEIECEVRDLESKSQVSWYRRGTGGPELVLDCTSSTKEGFSCTFKQHSVTLHIASARPDDSGLYLCAFRKPVYLNFSCSTALLVGDSWKAGSWVRVLAPHGTPPTRSNLVCAVGGTAGPVLVSWQGGAGKVLGLGGGRKLLLSPMGTAGGAGGLCEVQFNSSGPPVRRSAELRGSLGE
ncbi:titin-like [Tyto alba]|uniref:titin-like n=1 Tax=Tyto alba TaxID=56313 RepID=UPI001C667037|nr:titin-like [Tyto alba]